jgi:PBP1b-binding outer membrane lipoprotein LpoB
MISKRALPLLASLLSACASKPHPPQPIPALAEAHQCPAYPLPPQDLLKPPAKTDFLDPMPSPPPSKRSSSTN